MFTTKQNVENWKINYSTPCPDQSDILKENVLKFQVIRWLPKTVILEEVEAILKAFLLSCFGLMCSSDKKKVEKFHKSGKKWSKKELNQVLNWLKNTPKLRIKATAV